MDNSNPDERPEFDNTDPRDPSFVTPDSNSDDSDEWVSDDDLKALNEERDILGDDEAMQAERILKENLPAVTLAVIKLARSAQSENVRLNAAKYVIDRNLGKIGDPESTEDNPTQRLLEGVVVQN